MKLEFPGARATLDSEALVVYSNETLTTLSSALVGGGLGEARAIINLHVDKDYNNDDPASDLRVFARQRGVPEPFAGMMTAAYVERAGAANYAHAGCTVSAVVTAGLSNASAAGLSPPASSQPGTINMILLVESALTPTAMVDALICATEAKCDVLRERGVRTRQGYLATGTSTDAALVACTGHGAAVQYAGSGTLTGWLVARAARQALVEALG
ncbi:MAG: adenosylcobinamide amidohydrolase [Anaerolineales bacterium]|nr:adenosylcobinamide amidohydrolase [Anaerolineales bacterium]